MRKAVEAVLFAISLAAPGAANAYTLVLRSGERVEIGDAYYLSGSRVEYVADHELRRLDLAAVDLRATATANSESVGTFVARASATSPAAVRAQIVVATDEPSVTVTNADLEPYRAERERIDAQYAARTPRVAPEPATNVAPVVSDGLSIDDLQAWRSGFLALQDQVDAYQAQIDGIRSEVGWRERSSKRLSYRYNFGGSPIVYRDGGYYNLANPPYPYLRADDEIAQLNSRLIDLQIAQRAVSLERDRYLERARRAGVPPGWVRID